MRIAGILGAVSTPIGHYYLTTLWSPLRMDGQFAKIREYFLAALDCDGLDAQLRYVAEQCADAPELRANLEDMLRAHHQSGGFLASHAEATLEQPPLGRPGSVIGPYKLLQQIGEGGMGTVYMAEQTEPVERRVALKIIKPGMDTRQVIARFEAERQALAMMDHPNIARVLDAGTTDSGKGTGNGDCPPLFKGTVPISSPFSAAGEKDEGGRMKDERAATAQLDSSFIPHPSSFSPGRPYFVMELVKGTPITEYCDEHQRTPRQRLELFIPVCQAVQHAHQKGIIHRDIKPSNIMVAEYDDRPVPKVIDFGVAKAVEQRLTEKTMFTHLGQVVGTIDYMSPEQAKLNQLDIDTRSDIYSLGVVLYELLTGETPLDRQRLRAAPLDEMFRIIREEEPPRPSARVSTLQAAALSTVSQRRRVEPRQLSRHLRGELDWIVMKALEKDRARRYETATGLAHDIQRYLADEPVEACPPSVAYRLRKFVRRRAAPLVTVLAIAVALVIGAGVSLWQAAEARQAKAVAVQERQDAEQNLDLAREAVDKLLQQLEEGTLPPSPRFDGVRRAVLKEVEEFYRRLLAQKGDTPAVRFSMARAWRRIGEVKYEQQDFNAAIAAYEKAFATLEELIARHPAEPKYMAELALGNESLASSEVCYRWDNSRAERYLTRAIHLRQALAKLEPDEPDHSFRIMAVQARLDRVQGRSANEAWLRRQVESARAFAAQHPKHPGYRYQLTEMLDLLQDFLKKHGGQKEEIVKLLDEMVKLTEDSLREGGIERHYRVYLASTLTGKADFLQRHGEHAEAEKLFRQALTHYDDLFRRLKLGHHDEALRALCRIQLGEFLEKQDRLAEAEQVYRVALDDLSDGGWGQRLNALTHLTSVLVRQKRPEAAAARCAQHIASIRGEAPAAPDQDKFAMELVVTELMRAESAGEASVSVREATARLKLPGWIYPTSVAKDLSHRAGQIVRPAASPFPRTAVALAEEAARLEPDSFAMHNNLAWLLATHPDRRVWRPDRAIELATKAVQLKPTQGMFWNTLGVAQYRAGDYKAAIESLTKSMSLQSGGNAFDCFFLAMAHAQLKNPTEARKWYDKAVAWMKKNKPKDEELLRFRAEAAELLGMLANPPAVKPAENPAAAKPPAEKPKPEKPKS